MDRGQITREFKLEATTNAGSMRPRLQITRSRPSRPSSQEQRDRTSIARAPTEGRTGHSRASSREGVKFSLIAKHGEIWHLVGGNCHAVYWAKDVQN
jgi:hypothetical protein